MDVLGIDEVAVAQANTGIDDISGEVVNLIFVAIDESGSMSSYRSDMSKCLIDFKQAISESKEVDDILLARADFSDTINVGGYKKVVDFDVNYDADGGTAMYDVIVEGKEKLMQYMSYLKNQGVRVKAVFAVFSDGEDTASRMGRADGHKAIEELNSKEITTAFISFGGNAMPEAKAMDFKNILNVGSSLSELRRAFNTLSKSVISSSKAVQSKSTGFFDVP